MKYQGIATQDLDSDDFAFDRPAKRSRPRTKKRPDYSKAELGRIFTIDRGRYHAKMVNSGNHVIAVKARQLGRKGVIVGDLARIVGDTSGDEGTLSRIVDIEPRETMLSRSGEDSTASERPIVANASQLLIMTALAEPTPKTGMIDRILVAGYDAKLKPILCLTKSDLASPKKLIDAYSPLDIPIVTTSPNSDLTKLRELLENNITVMVGHSGVGKSTLINRLVPDANRAVGLVNETTGAGRHTSTSAIALELPEGNAVVIDTPGVRSFGLSHVTCQSLLEAFEDLSPYLQLCPRGCKHSADQPECGLDIALSKSKISPQRLASLRRVLDGLLKQPNY